MTDYKQTIDFIKSVYGNQEFTPLAVPVFTGNEKQYLNECIDSSFVSSVGEFVDRFEKIDEETYNKYLHAVHEREKELPVDLQLNIRKFASKHPRRRKDEIIKMFDRDKRYVSVLNAYTGRVNMYGKENINEQFLFEYNEALYGIVETRTFFHELDDSIKIPDLV